MYFLRSASRTRFLASRFLAFLIFGTILGQSSGAFAGGWTQAPGSYYLKISDRFIIGSGVFGREGDVFGGVPRYNDHQLNIYSEVGVTDRITILGMLTPIGFVRMDSRDTFYSGPMVLGARVGLLRGRTPLALEFHGGFSPGVGDTVFDREIEIEGGETRDVRYQPSVANVRAEAQLQLGHGFSIAGASAWFTASLGARLNSEFLNALTGFAQIGVKPGIFTFALQMAWYEPFFAEIETTNISGVGDTRYLGFGIQGSVALSDNVAIQLGFEGVVYAASNAATPSLSIGLEITGDGVSVDNRAP